MAEMLSKSHTTSFTTGTSSNSSRNCGSLSRTPSFPKNTLHRASNGRQTCRCPPPPPASHRLLTDAAPATMSTGSWGNPTKGTPGWHLASLNGSERARCREEQPHPSLPDVMATKPALHHVSGVVVVLVLVLMMSLFDETALVFVPTNAEQTCGRAQRWHFLLHASLCECQHFLKRLEASVVSRSCLDVSPVARSCMLTVK